MQMCVSVSFVATLFILISVLHRPANCQNLLRNEAKNQISLLSSVEESELNGQDSYLPKNYNKYEVPLFKNRTKGENATEEDKPAPLKCGIYLNIRAINDFDEVQELVTLDVDFLLTWTDFNLAYQGENKSDLNLDTPVTLNPSFLRKIWMPDIHFDEMVDISQPSVLGNSVTVALFRNDGYVYYRSRFLIKLSCDMNFRHYPADTQECEFSIRSFSHDMNSIFLKWNKAGNGVYLLETGDPNFDYQISERTEEETFLEIGPVPYEYDDGNYTILKFTLKARRKMTYHLIQTYFTSVFFVIVTWLCFLIPPDMFEVRVGIAMSTLLTLTSMFSSVREQTPIVSYVKAIDIWMVSCILFIFLALGGFTLTAWIKRGLSRLNQTVPEDEAKQRVYSLSVLDRNRSKVMDAKRVEKYLSRYKRLMLLIETLAFYLLFGAYILFNGIYWGWLLIDSEYLSWEINSDHNKIL